MVELYRRGSATNEATPSSFICDDDDVEDGYNDKDEDDLDDGYDDDALMMMMTMKIMSLFEITRMRTMMMHMMMKMTMVILMMMNTTNISI